VPTKERKRLRRPMKSKPIWDLERDGITQSGLGVFMRCPEHFRLAFHEGWSVRGISVPLEFGSMFHHAEALVVEHPQQFTPSEAVLDYCYRQARDRKMGAQEIEKLDILGCQCTALLEWHQRFWEDVDSEKKWVNREGAFRAETFGLTLRGRIDGVFRKEDGNIWIRENKTKGQINEVGMHALHWDLQSMLYAHVTEVLTGEKVAGIEYNVIRRPQLRQKKGESVADFVVRIETDIAERPAHYFMRWDVALVEEDMTRFLNFVLGPNLRRLLAWWEFAKYGEWEQARAEGLHYLNPQELITVYGTSPYFDLITRNSPYGLVRRKVVFPELED